MIIKLMFGLIGVSALLALILYIKQKLNISKRSYITYKIKKRRTLINI